jgi:hypothetical protein
MNSEHHSGVHIDLFAHRMNSEHRSGVRIDHFAHRMASEHHSGVHIDLFAHRMASEPPEHRNFRISGKATQSKKGRYFPVATFINLV